MKWLFQNRKVWKFRTSIFNISTSTILGFVAGTTGNWWLILGLIPISIAATFGSIHYDN